MPTGEINQTSMILGELSAAAKEQARQQDAMFRKIDEAIKAIHEVGGVSKMTAESHAALKKTVIEEIAPRLENLEKLRERGKGFAMAIGTVAGAAGAGLTAIAAKVKMILPGIPS